MTENLLVLLAQNGRDPVDAINHTSATPVGECFFPVEIEDWGIGFKVTWRSGREEWVNFEDIKGFEFKTSEEANPYIIARETRLRDRNLKISEAGSR